jgi:hypothetical protein
MTKVPERSWKSPVEVEFDPTLQMVENGCG